jgi:hypothetical protein
MTRVQVGPGWSKFSPLEDFAALKNPVPGPQHLPGHVQYHWSSELDVERDSGMCDADDSRSASFEQEGTR